MNREWGFFASELCTCLYVMCNEKCKSTKISVRDINIQRKVIEIVNLLDKLEK